MTPTPCNSLLDGRRPDPLCWVSLDWPRAWVDPGPSPTGNPGPYLHVPCLHCGGQVWHRIYPRPRKGMAVRVTWQDGGWQWNYEAVQ